MLSEFEGKSPRIHDTAFVHPQATVTGDVKIGEHSSVWPGAVLRGDFSKVEIGKYTCIQDSAVVQPADIYPKGKPTYVPVKIGDHVIVGQQALVRGARVENESLVGAGAVVFDKVRIRKNSMVGMGGVVLSGMEVPKGTIVVGIPARPLREMKKGEIRNIRLQAKNYADLAERYKRNIEGKSGER